MLLLLFLLLCLLFFVFCCCFLFGQIDTTHIIWSFHSRDPENDIDSNLMRHEHRGALSVNLLGGNPKEINRPYEGYFDFTVSNVSQSN